MATEQIPTSIIADDAVTGAKIENNPTVAGNLTVSGTTTATGALTASGGIANAGTITAGTLGSSVVFPAGHVLQVQQNYVTNSAVSMSSTGTMAALSNSYYTFTWGVSITTIRANSKIALIGHLGNAHMAGGQSSSEINLGILRYKDGTKEAFVGNTQDGYSSSGPQYGLARLTALQNGEKAPSVCFLDAPADAAGTVLQYRFACMTLSGVTNIQSGTSSSLMAMEIAV